MAATPRRSTRGQVFTPVQIQPHTVSIAPANTTFRWTSAPKATLRRAEDGKTAPEAGEWDGNKTFYTSFTRITQKRGAANVRKSSTGLTPVVEIPRGKRIAHRPEGKRGGYKFLSESESETSGAEEDEEYEISAAGPSTRRRGGGEVESRFTIGDGVSVMVEGGKEGIAMLTALWEDPDESASEEGEDVDDHARNRVSTPEGGHGPRMMAQVHWFFRKEDLPGVMRNLHLEENEVLLAASSRRPPVTELPISLLLKTVPIYSKAVFMEQFPDVGKSTKWKGWSYTRTGVYWCSRAYDKSVRGGKVWKVDVDDWKGRGRAGYGWDMSPPMYDEPQSAQSDSESEESEAEIESDEDADSGSGDDEDTKPKQTPRKRKARAPVTPRKTAKRKKVIKETATPRRRRVPHAKASASRLPATVPLENLPADPYQRALRLLHVGATPESLPCREEDFFDVLGRMEEGIESGGGGCLYIAGVPGTGKTATVHAVVKELKRKAEDGELAPFSYVEINGLKIPSPQHAYTVLWESISGQQGTSAKTALRGLEAHFGHKGELGGIRGPRGHTFVVLMDELDQLLTTKQDVVYNFFNWPTMRDSQLFVIAIANRMDLPQHLAAKIKSRLGLQTLLFQPYDRASLVEIVQSRLIPHPKSTEDHKVLMPDAITLAATKMAGTNGDARRVLDACRRAVEVALAHSPPRPVSARDMVGVLNAMSSSPVALFIRSCSPQQKMLLAALVRCVRREGMPEIAWHAVRSDHDALTRSLAESNDLLSDAELVLVRSSLLATHALTAAPDPYTSPDDRRLALGMEIGEVGRVLMNEGDSWRRALAGT